MKKVKIIVKKPMGWKRIWTVAEITCQRKDMKEMVMEFLDFQNPRNILIDIEEV